MLCALSSPMDWILNNFVYLLALDTATNAYFSSGVYRTMHIMAVYSGDHSQTPA